MYRVYNMFQVLGGMVKMSAQAWFRLEIVGCRLSNTRATLESHSLGIGAPPQKIGMLALHIGLYVYTNIHIYRIYIYINTYLYVI